MWQFSNRFRFFFFKMVVIDAWSRYFVELLSRLVCQLTISFHTLLRMTIHVIIPWRNTKILRELKFVCSSPQKFAIRTWFWYCPQYHCLFHIVFECSPSIHDPRKTLVLPNRLLCWVLSTPDQDFVSFQPIWCHPHTQIRKILFHAVQRDIPNLELSQPCFNKIFSHCLSEKSPAKRMTVQIPFLRNDWVFHTAPWFWPFVSW